ncbi:Imm74 family immunity protein [Methylocapsa aurea]|uniref:Imm74 family immunity protein n=1 Tax=Methylocapsa aurea TaxID=663610 RepID=UPI00055EEF3D|nr:Imm74 family immunity protein [Methylocapsa aurea]
MAKRRGAEFQITLTEGSIRVRSAERVLTISPAPSLPGEDDPADFIVDLDSILCWDSPHEDVEIEVEELQRIVQAIEAEFERLGLAVEFD